MRDDDEVLVVWYLLGWLEFLREDFSASKFYLERVVHVRCLLYSCNNNVCCIVL